MAICQLFQVFDVTSEPCLLSSCSVSFSHVGLLSGLSFEEQASWPLLQVLIYCVYRNPCRECSYIRFLLCLLYRIIEVLLQYYSFREAFPGPQSKVAHRAAAPYTVLLFSDHLLSEINVVCLFTYIFLTPSPNCKFHKRSSRIEFPVPGTVSSQEMFWKWVSV